MTAKAKILAAMPGSASQLSAATGYAQSTVQWHIGTLKTNSLTHIGEWVQCGTGQPTAIYAAGEGQDAPRIHMGQSKSVWARHKRNEARRIGPVVLESSVSYAVRSQPQLARVWA